MRSGIDASVNTTASLNCLAAAGFGFVARYYGGSAGKRLTRAEAEAISAAGMQVVAVWESASTSVGYFSHDKGLADGRAAYRYANGTIGQPAGTPIYFAVDYDAAPGHVSGAIGEYFRGVREAFALEGAGNPRYTVAVYGSGRVCRALLASGAVSHTWLAQSTGWAGYNDFVDWNIKQHAEQTLCGIRVDTDDANDGFGGFRVGGTFAGLAGGAEEGTFAKVVRAIEAEGQALASIPGVVTVRPGYRFTGGRITADPVISVGVLRKRPRDQVPESELVPRTVAGAPVDVIPAGAATQLRAAASPAAGGGDGDVAAALESVTAGTGVVDLRTPLEAESASPAGAAPAVPLDEYPEPPHALQEVDEEMTLVLHSGPDTGWRLLREFLGGTRERLTATMYEFTASYILQALGAAVPAPRTLDMVMDYQADPSGALDSPRARAQLAQALGGRFRFAWAPVASDRVTTRAYFPSAYHIKVVVRDGSSVWLSSGNWKPSSQPENDPFNPPSGFDPGEFLRSHNREWHVIAHSRALAEQFDYFIGWDLAESAKVQAPPAPPPAARLAPTVLFPEAAPPAAPPQPRFFREKELRGKIRVMPLLTPRHFAEHVLPLLRRARRRVWFQNQSLKPDASRPEYMQLFEALRDLSTNPDIDTRVIARGDYGPHELLMALQEAGFEMSRIRLQNGCHTKGLVIDDDVVVVGSHNWTGQGTLANRDASLIIHHPDAVRFYADIFEYDWSNLASERVEHDEVTALVVPGTAPIPPGMHALTPASLGV
jgi:phosphatidylserine/phosphatidylglycerophosphate/cardiolipin synthase-like enzyme